MFPVPLTRYSSETDYLMQPGQYKYEDNEDIIEAVMECVEQLNESDKELVYSVFYERMTYEELKDVAGVKAKSHAWKKTMTALENLKAIMEGHPALSKYTKE